MGLASRGEHRAESARAGDREESRCGWPDPSISTQTALYRPCYRLAGCTGFQVNDCFRHAYFPPKTSNPRARLARSVGPPREIFRFISSRVWKAGLSAVFGYRSPFIRSRLRTSPASSAHLHPALNITISLFIAVALRHAPRIPFSFDRLSMYSEIGNRETSQTATLPH